MESKGNPTQADKAVRLIEYLLRLASLRSKLIRSIEEYQKVLWFSDIPHDPACFTQAWGPDEEHDQDEWLEVQNRREPSLPAIPAGCQDWVHLSSLRIKTDLPNLLLEITRQIKNPAWREGSDQPEFIAHIERLDEYPEIQTAWDSFVQDKWLPWAEAHDAWEKVHNVYSGLFAIHQDQLRLGEEYELVLGIGLLSWQTASGQRIRRHLVVADATLEFEARLGKFIVRPHTDGAKVRPEFDMLDVEEQPPRAEEAAKSSLAAAEDDPWKSGCIEDVLRALVHSINPPGLYESYLDSRAHPSRANR